MRLKRLLIALALLLGPIAVIVPSTAVAESPMCQSTGQCTILNVQLDKTPATAATVVAKRTPTAGYDDVITLTPVNGSKTLYSSVTGIYGSFYDPISGTFCNPTVSNPTLAIYSISVTGSATTPSNVQVNACGNFDPKADSNHVKTVTVAVNLPNQTSQFGGVSGYIVGDNGATTAPCPVNTVINIKGNTSGLTTKTIKTTGTQSSTPPTGNGGTFTSGLSLKPGSYTLSGTCANVLNDSFPFKATFAVTAGKITDIGKVDGLKPGATPAPSPGAAGAAAGDNADLCDAGSFSWIVCPMMKVAAGTIDKAQSALQTFLNVPPLSTTTDGNGTAPYVYNVWKLFRNIADVFFVLAFFIVIFGTAIGIQNYNIKKILPKLIAAAVLVQFSFWIAGFIIDIGNVFGYGIKQLFATAIPADAIKFDFTGTQGAWAVMDETLLLVGAGVAIGVGLVMLSATAIIGALIAILVVIGTLLVRQVMIVLLVIMSPLAFAAWVLPNTERLFQFWYKNLLRAVMLFPLIALLFGAAKIFAIAAMAAAPDSMKMIFGIIGYIIPLFLVPVTFKMAGSLMNMGAAGVAKLGGAANKQWGAGSDRDKRAATRRQLNSSQRALDAPDGSMRQKINSKRAGFGFKPTAQNTAAMAGIVSKEDKARFDAADRKLAGASIDELTTAGMSSDKHTARAAVQRLAAKNQTGKLEEVLQGNALFGNDASSTEWQKAISGKEGDLFKLAPHLVNPSHDYGNSSAEAVAGLSDEGYNRWASSAGSARVKSIAGQIAQSQVLRNKLTETRRQAVNASSGARMGESHYIPDGTEHAQIALGEAMANDIENAPGYNPNNGGGTTGGGGGPAGGGGGKPGGGAAGARTAAGPIPGGGGWGAGGPAPSGGGSTGGSGGSSGGNGSAGGGGSHSGGGNAGGPGPSPNIPPSGRSAAGSPSPYPGATNASGASTSTTSASKAAPSTSVPTSLSDKPDSVVAGTAAVYPAQSSNNPPIVYKVGAAASMEPASSESAPSTIDTGSIIAGTPATRGIDQSGSSITYTVDTNASAEPSSGTPGQVILPKSPGPSTTNPVGLATPDNPLPANPYESSIVMPKPESRTNLRSPESIAREDAIGDDRSIS